MIGDVSWLPVLVVPFEAENFNLANQSSYPGCSTIICRFRYVMYIFMIHGPHIFTLGVISSDFYTGGDGGAEEWYINQVVPSTRSNCRICI
jgi:hypothetical protein